jgi:polysaccharide chain length determinant protein (PEP-CTERM system associated)
LNEQPAFTTSGDAGIKVQIREYLDLARRRKLWIILLTLGISICIAVVAMRLPSIYRAETVILVDPQKTPDSVVPTSVSGTVADRLSTIRQEIMSPTQLGLLTKEMGLYPELRDKVSEQELVSRMQRSTTIEVVDSGGQRLSVLRIAFTDTDRNQVARVANRLASLFIERNLKARQQHLNETSQFLETELQETKRQLEEKERLLQDVKSRNIMELPESKQHYLKALKALRNQLRISQERVDRDRQTKVDLQSMAGNVAPTTHFDPPSSDPNAPSQARLQKLEEQMKAMLVRYGPNYLDVRKLRNEINQLKVKAESEKSAGDAPDLQAGTPAPQKRNPVVEAEVNKLDQDIEDQTKAQAKLQKQIQNQDGKLQQVAAFADQIAELTRDYDSLRMHYSQLQEKNLSARIVGELEMQSARERFKVVDAAVPPESPYGPKRTIMILEGVFLGLLCGIGGAFLVDISDGSVRHEREAAQIFGKAVLAGIPKITSPRERAWARWRMASLTAGTAGVASAFGFVISKLVG